MSPELLLRFAYAFNILCLVPVLIGLAQHQGSGVLAALGGNIPNSDGLRWLVISLWSGVALASTAGLFLPRPFMGLLVFQVAYKAVFLLFYAGPLAVRGAWDQVPVGPSAVFLFIVLAWPLIITRALA